MTPTKKDDGFWHVDIRPAGRKGKRYRRKFKSRTDAAQYIQACIKKDGEEKEAQEPSNRLLSDLVEPWLKLHGHALKEKKRKNRLLFLANELGDPKAKDFTASMFLEYRNKRIEDGATINTLNHHLTYLKSMFNVLIQNGEWQGENPLLRVKKIAFDQKELTYLTEHEMRMLLAAAKDCKSDSLELVIQVCLATGARWGEAERLTAEQIKGGQIMFTKTKNTLRRSIPVTDELIKTINPKKKPRGRLFEDCYEQFKTALKKAEITLPKGQRTHVLRHSFASHYMIDDGDLFSLNKVLGHKTIQQTMTYAHLAKDHLEDVRFKNPLAKLYK